MKNDLTKNVYKTIVEALGQEIFVCDGTGKVLFANPASIEVNELDMDNILGRNVRDLVSDGYFSESSTLKVLKERKPVSILQTLKGGKRIIANGVPIFDKNGEITMVITSSQDIDAVNTLLETLDKQEQEIETLKKALSSTSDFDAVDPATIQTKAALEKVASLDMPVLIKGESGTGKQVAARHIHFSGKRADKPISKVNCTSLDEDFLEKEIFGSEVETDGSVKIKHGKLDYANGGTLILNNISYMPPHIQAKLFDYIDTGKFTRAGGTHEIRSTARIVAITGMNLKELSSTGMFMKALFYRLNTVPISIPPLRNRTKDIPHLSTQYIARCNDKYKSKKILSKDAQGVLASHTWPGNLIELNQTIEGSYILTDGPVINGDTVYNVIHDAEEQAIHPHTVYCEDIIPLKEAKHQLEEQLVKRAFEVYKTTRKTAEVLEVNQSTVSRILNKY